MNNMCYMFAREMHKQGDDVTLWINAPADYKLDRPEAFDADLKYPYPDWIVEMTPKERINVTHLPFLPFIAHRYLKMIKQYDVIILNGNYTSLAKYVPADKTIIGLFAGDDLDVYCNPSRAKYLASHITKKNVFFKPLYPILYSIARFIIWERRQGVKKMAGINYYPIGIDPITDNMLSDLMTGKNYKRLNLRGIPFDSAEYSDVELKSRFSILNFTRFTYANPSKSFSKRSDIMIKGIASFINANNIKEEDVDIIFFEKGEDVELAKELIKKLNIEKYVTWEKTVSQNELHDYIRKSDVTFDQLGEHWVGYGIVSMAIGRPLIANGRPEVFEKITNEVSPICQAKTPEEVDYWLTLLYKDFDLRKKIGKQSSNYVRNHYNIKNTVSFITSFNQEC